jgi:hypothetical protein
VFPLFSCGAPEIFLKFLASNEGCGDFRNLRLLMISNNLSFVDSLDRFHLWTKWTSHFSSHGEKSPEACAITKFRDDCSSYGVAWNVVANNGEYPMLLCSDGGKVTLHSLNDDIELLLVCNMPDTVTFARIDIVENKFIVTVGDKSGCICMYDVYPQDGTSIVIASMKGALMPREAVQFCLQPSIANEGTHTSVKLHIANNNGVFQLFGQVNHDAVGSLETLESLSLLSSPTRAQFLNLEVSLFVFMHPTFLKGNMAEFF